MSMQVKVETFMIDHLRHFALNLEKYKEVQNFPMQEDINQEDC